MKTHAGGSMLTLSTYYVGEYMTNSPLGLWEQTYRCPDHRSATRSLRLLMEENGFPRGDWEDVALDLMLGRELQSPGGWKFRVKSYTIK